MNTAPNQNRDNIAIKNKNLWGKSGDWYWQGLYCHWRVLGENNLKPLVLIHGFGASSDHWRNNAETFVKAGYKVYGIDLIGFGKSEQPGAKQLRKLDNLFWAKQLEGFLNEVVKVKIHGKAILIGNSLGSLVALTTIARNPELVEVIVAAPLPDPAFMQIINFKSPRYFKQVKRIFVRAFFSLMPLEIILPIITKTILIKVALQAAYYHSIKSDITLQEIVEQPSRKRSAAQSLRAMCIGMSLRPEISKGPFLLKRIDSRLKRPKILLVWGRQDRLVPLDIAYKIMKQYPWLDLEVINKSGHCPHDESHQEFNNYVLNWLKINLEGTNSKA